MNIKGKLHAKTENPRGSHSTVNIVAQVELPDGSKHEAQIIVSTTSLALLDAFKRDHVIAGSLTVEEPSE